MEQKAAKTAKEGQKGDTKLWSAVCQHRFGFLFGGDMRNTLMSVGVGLLLIVVFLARPMAGQSKAQRPTDIEIKLAFDFCEWYPPKKERMLCEKKLEPESKRGIEASKKLRDEILDKLASFNKTSQFGLVQAIVRVKFWRENKAPPTDADVEEFFRATF